MTAPQNDSERIGRVEAALMVLESLALTGDDHIAKLYDSARWYVQRLAQELRDRADAKEMGVNV